MQLQSHLTQFDAAGLAVLALTYDAPALQQKFIDAHAISYPLLSDVDAVSVSNLGILDSEYKPGSSNYGVPHPGVFVVNPAQRIVGKIFVEGYEKRVDADGVLAFAEQVLPSSP